MTYMSFAEISPEERSSASILSSLAMYIANGVGVALAALLLNFSRLLRHAASLAPFDFRLALVLIGAFGALAVFYYAGLARGRGRGGQWPRCTRRASPVPDLSSARGGRPAVEQPHDHGEGRHAPSQKAAVSKRAPTRPSG